MLFCVWEDASVWSHWNHSFVMYLSNLGPVSCVAITWVSSSLTAGSGCNLMAAKWQVFFSSWCPHQLTIGCGCSCWWLWHPLSTDMVGNTPCLSVFGHAFQKELCVLWAGLLTFLMESSLLESFSSSSCVAFRVGPRMQMRYMSVFLPFFQFFCL